MGLLIAHAKELLTINGSSLKDLGIIEDGAVAIEEDRIIDFGKSDDLIRRYHGYELIDATNKVVMPGFVDPHTHLIWAGYREKELLMKLEGKSYIEILRSGGGINSTVKPTRRASVDELVELGKARADLALKYGTTTLEAKSGYGLNKAEEIKCLKAVKLIDKSHPVDLIPTFLGAHVIPEGKDKLDYVEEVIDMLPEALKYSEFCDIFCENGIFEYAESKRILEEARALGFKLKVHADEFSDSGGAKLAAELGAISAEHLLCSSRDDLSELGRRGVIGVLLPANSFSSMTRYADFKLMKELNIQIALGSDLNPNCFCESMQEVIALACYNLKMTPDEAIIASTLNSACALGLGEEVGSIQKGKKADIIILNIPNYLFLGYHFGVNKISQVIKNGEIVSGDYS